MMPNRVAQRWAAFAALEVATGKVIRSPHRHDRAAEFKKFLADLDNNVPV
ncbi:hypothetical protein ABZ478_19905 [Streptomyces sp. NPDC005706]